MSNEPIIKPEWIPSAYHDVRDKQDFQPADAIPSGVLKEGKGGYKRKGKRNIKH